MINWQNIQTAGYGKIGSLVEKDINFLVPILREYRRKK